MATEKFIFSLTLHHDQDTGEFVLRATAYEGTQSEQRFHTMEGAMEYTIKSMKVAAAEKGPAPGAN